MLVLTRKLGQSITLSGDIKVSVLGVEGDRVSLGIDAPRQIRIFRSELLEATRALNRESVVSQPLTVRQFSSLKNEEPDNPEISEKKEE